MANGHGGVRPGAGRKTSATKASQITRRQAFETEVSDEDWRAIVRTAVSQAKQGDIAARAWLAPWLVGKVPEEINANVAQVIEIVYSDSNSADPTVSAKAASRPTPDHS